MRTVGAGLRDAAGLLEAASGLAVLPFETCFGLEDVAPPGCFGAGGDVSRTKRPARPAPGALSLGGWRLQAHRAARSFRKNRDQLVRLGGYAVDHGPEVRLAGYDRIQLHFPLRGRPGIDKRGCCPSEEFEQLKPGLGWDHQFPIRGEQVLPLQPLDDFGARRRCADALGFLQPLAHGGGFHEAPGVLHGVDQRAFVVARRRLCPLVLDTRFGQRRLFAIGQRRQRLFGFAAASGSAAP